MWSVFGHLHSIEHLERGLATGRLAHAMLFTGPAGIGKTALAIDLARAANCVGSDPPCQACVHCRQITGQTHPDVTVIERESGRESIQIESVRELRDAASLRPFQGRKKVYIIAGAENLSAQAADALLKTLEEPQPQVMIILTAPDEAALPDTVVSRCQVLEMQPVDTETVLQALRNAGEPAADSERIARLAMGRVGWA
ncbi:MAG: DNA polymerase III subunit delta', partial [Chloroflexota bacterium]